MVYVCVLCVHVYVEKPKNENLHCKVLALHEPKSYLLPDEVLILQDYGILV